jgi:hypothetical protein
VMDFGGWKNVFFLVEETVPQAKRDIVEFDVVVEVDLDSL